MRCMCISNYIPVVLLIKRVFFFNKICLFACTYDSFTKLQRSEEEWFAPTCG